MSISIQKLLAKIEEEVRLAKGSSSEARMRERIQAIKTLCELVLEDSMQREFAVREVNPVPVQMSQPQPLHISQPKKVDMDNEANGDSLFDF